MGPWLPCRGGHSYFRRDRFQQAHAHPGSVPGSTDFRTDRIHVGRTDALRRVYLPGCVRLAEGIVERIVVPWHISVGGRVGIPVGVLVPVADRVRIPELVPVRLPEADPDSNPDPAPDPDPDSIGPDPHPDIRADITVRTGFVMERMRVGACLVDHRRP